MKVSSDDEALKLMNDSRYGLTASVWTNDENAFLDLVPQIEAGTVYQSTSLLLVCFTSLLKDCISLDRSDYCDPSLGVFFLP